MLRIFTALVFALFLAPSLDAQVLINEFSASNLHGFVDSFGKTEDWIELYNTSDQAVDLSGWHLSDKESKPGKWTFPEGSMIEANGYLVAYCSGRDAFVNEEYHTNFKLAQSTGNDIVLLSDDNENIIEQFELALTLTEHSLCRVEDGGSEWAISTSPSLASSNDGTPQVNGYTATPNMDLNAGFYDGPQTITLTNNEENSILRYTLDGTNPTPNSPEYTEPITIDKTTVIKGQAFSNDPMILPGKMDFNTYFIDENFELAVFSVAANDLIELANGQGELIPIGSLEYFNLDDEREATSFGDLNRHGQDSWVLDHRSIDWISRDEMGYSKEVKAKLFNYSNRDAYQRFMFRNSGDDNYPAINDGEHEGSTHIRDEYVHNLGHYGDLKLDQRAVERVIVFLNGQYWGVYGMREKAVDHDFTSEYYDQGKYEIQYLSTWDQTETEYGGLAAIRDWENLRNFILENDMGIEENYKLAEDSINMTSMIDYFIINMNVVAKDWLNYNTGWWRGLNPDGDHKKWGYILWDLDATFDYYINYTGVPNESPTASPCDINDISDSMDDFFGTQITDHGSQSQEDPDCPSVANGSSPYPNSDIYFQAIIRFQPQCCQFWDEDCQDTYDWLAEFPENLDFFEGYSGNVGMHEKLFIKLLDESDEFRQLYLGRYADLMNTTFSCEFMNNMLDSMLNVIEPEMPRQIQRWGGSMGEWQQNVNKLKDFIDRRCELLGSTAVSCFDDISGPYEVTLMTTPEGIGEIDFNTLDIEEFPWVGDYFGGMENKIKAKVFDEFEDDYYFSHWISSAGNMIFPDIKERKATITLMGPDTLTAVFLPEGVVSNNEIAATYDMQLFPNPVKNELFISYELTESKELDFTLFSLSGKKVAEFNAANGEKSVGKHVEKLAIDENLASGLYMLVVNFDHEPKTFKVNIKN